MDMHGQRHIEYKKSMFKRAKTLLFKSFSLAYYEMSRETRRYKIQKKKKVEI